MIYKKIENGSTIWNDKRTNYLKFIDYNEKSGKIEFEYMNQSTNESDIISIKIGNWRSYTSTEYFCDKTNLCWDDERTDSGPYVFRPQDG